MGDFVNSENTAYRPGGTYGKVISEIEKDGVCPFCPENLPKYHKNPVLKDGAHWLLTNNMYPYEGARYHVLMIHKKHIASLDEVLPEAWAEAKSLIEAFAKEKHIPGGTLVLRFGETAYTGASVSHLHANFVSAEGGDKNRKPIVARIG